MNRIPLRGETLPTLAREGLKWLAAQPPGSGVSLTQDTENRWHGSAWFTQGTHPPAICVHPLGCDGFIEWADKLTPEELICLLSGADA